MKMCLYILLIIGSLLVPLEKADVADLQPVEAALVRENKGQTEIITDTGAWGKGENAQEALADLIKNTPGIVYLDTAKYLIIDEQSTEQIESLRKELKGNVRLCMWNGDGEMADTLKYFSVHDQLPKLKNWKLGDRIPKYISAKCE